MSSPLSEEERFKNNAVVLARTLVQEINRLKETENKCRDIPGMIAVAPVYLETKNAADLIEGFIEACEENPTFWSNIKEKNLDFFVSNADEIFVKRLPIENVGIFYQLFNGDNGKPFLKAEVINKIWAIFTSFVKISIKYIHRKRQPILHQDHQGNQVVRYTKEFHNLYNLEELAREWDITFQI